MERCGELEAGCRLWVVGSRAWRHRSAPTLNPTTHHLLPTTYSLSPYFALPSCRGTLAPFFLASDKPIAIACLRLVTFPPWPLGPLRSVPCFRRRIAYSTLLLAPLLYRRPLLLRDLLRAGIRYLTVSQRQSATRTAASLMSSGDARSHLQSQCCQLGIAVQGLCETSRYDNVSGKLNGRPW